MSRKKILLAVIALSLLLTSTIAFSVSENKLNETNDQSQIIENNNDTNSVSKKIHNVEKKETNFQIIEPLEDNLSTKQPSGTIKEFVVEDKNLESEMASLEEDVINSVESTKEENSLIESENVEQKSNIESSDESETPKKLPPPNIIFADISNLDNDVEIVNDDFSDFYISDESGTLPLFDGEYYFTAKVNKEVIGEVYVKYENNILHIRKIDVNVILETKSTQKLLDIVNLGISEDSINIKDLEKFELGIVYDTNEFTIDFDIPSKYLKEKAISISNRNFLSNKLMKVKKSDDFEYIQPADLSIISNLYFKSAFYYNLKRGLQSNWYRSLFSLNTVNKIGYKDFGINIGIDINLMSPYIHFKNYSINYYVPEENLIVTAGNIYGGRGNFGFNIAKDTSVGKYEYLGNQYTNLVELQEDSELIITINNNDIFNSKYIAKGIYTLKDFVFVSGANKVIIKYRKANTYVDSDSGWQVKVMHLGWDSRLINKGETFFNYGFNLDYLNTQKRGIALYGAQQFGITNFFTFGFNASLQDFILSTDLKFITSLYYGALDFTPSIKYDIMKKYISYKLRMGYKLFPGQSKEFGNYSIDISFTDKKYNNSLGTDYNITIGNYYSNRIKDINFNLSLLTSINFDKNFKYKNVLYNIGTGFSLNLLDNLTFRAGLNVSGNTLLNGLDPDIKGTVGISMKLGNNVSASASSNYHNLNLGANFKLSDRDNLSLNVNNVGLRDYESFKKHNIGLNYSHRDNNWSLIANQQIGDFYNYYATNLSFNTSFAAINGHIANGMYIHDSFVVVHDSKDSNITISKDDYNANAELSKTFNNVLFNFLNNWNLNTLTVFRDTKDGNVTMNSFEIEPRPYRGFFIDLDNYISYTVSGKLLDGDEPVADYSTPTYMLSQKDNKDTWINKTDYYLFTDENGKFELYGVVPAIYKLDIKTEEGWRAIVFDLTNLDTNIDKNVVVLEDINLESLKLVENDEILTDIKVKKRISDSEYWEAYYNEMPEE